MNPIRKMTTVTSKLLPLEDASTVAKKKKQHFSAKLRTMMGNTGLEVAKQSPKNKFRAVARFVINNLEWMGDQKRKFEDEEEEEETKESDAKEKEESEDFRDEDMADLILMEDETFTREEKYILVRPPEMRTEEEIDAIFIRLTNFQSMSKYSQAQQRCMAAVVGFGSYKKGKYILKQGDSTAIGARLYFVGKGTVKLLRKTEDSFQAGLLVEKEVGLKRAGDQFGEVALLYGSERPASLLTDTDVELVELKKKDFEKILKESLWSHWTEMKTALETYYYFDTWDEELMKTCCGIANLKWFEENQIIVDFYDDEHPVLLSDSYFILKGKCEMMGALIVDKTTGKNGSWTKYSLHRNQEGIHLTSSKRETIFLRLCSLSEGQVFSIGESTRSKRIITAERTKFLIVPTQFLLEADKYNLWERTKRFLNDFVPPIETQFQVFLDTIKWKKARKKFIAGLKHSNRTAQYADVPYSSRMAEVHRYEDIYDVDPELRRKYLKIEKVVYELGKLHLPIPVPEGERPKPKNVLNRADYGMQI